MEVVTLDKNTNKNRGLFCRFVDYLKKKDAADAEKKPLIGYRGRQIVILSLVVGFSVFVGYNLLKFTVIDAEMRRQRANSQ